MYPYPLLFTVVYTVIDEWYQRAGWRLVRSRPGVKPRFSDSEVLTLEVLRDLDGETHERRWYRRVANNWRGLFPQVPERSVLHKRIKSLCWLLDVCRCWLRDTLLTDDLRRLIDGTPVPVCEVSRVGRPDGSSAGQQWLQHGAEIGRCAARGWWFFGFKLVLTATVAFTPRDGRTSPAPTFLVGSISRYCLAVHGAAGVGGTAYPHDDRSLHLPLLQRFSCTPGLLTVGASGYTPSAVRSSRRCPSIWPSRARSIHWSVLRHGPPIQ